MKKLFIILVISLPILSCKTARVTAPARDTTNKATSDTALQGDRMKTPVKP